ncbi:MAG: alpha-L-fucosidase C-terminal domain-containing protein, partial [Gemmatimonadota bacterium]
TRGTDGALYVMYLAEEGETRLPERLTLTGWKPSGTATVSLLGSDAALSWRASGTGLVLEVPEPFRDSPPCDYVWVFRISEVEPAGAPPF